MNGPFPWPTGGGSWQFVPTPQYPQNGPIYVGTPPVPQMNGYIGIPPNPTLHPEAAKSMTRKDLKKAKKFWDDVEKMYKKDDGKKDDKKGVYSLLETWMLCSTTALASMLVSVIASAFIFR